MYRLQVLFSCCFKLLALIKLLGFQFFVKMFQLQLCICESFLTSTECITPAQAFHSYGTVTGIINMCIKQKLRGITVYRDLHLLKYKRC